MHVLKRSLLTAAAGLAFAGSASAALFDNVYLFGDSLLDGGNSFAITNGFPPYSGTSGLPYVPAGLSGRLTNGPTAGEVLAANPAIRGIPVLPSVLGGTNYAVAGAATREYVNILGSAAPPPLNGLPPPTMTTSNQIARGYWYFDDTVVDTPYNFNVNAIRPYGIAPQVSNFTAPAGFDANRSLFVMWGGANDFFVDALTGPAGAGNVISFIDTLYGKGARNFLVLNLPDLSLTPYGQSLSAVEKFGLSQLSAAFNAGLATGIQNLRSANGDIRIVDFQVDDFWSGLVSNPTLLTSLGFDAAKVYEPCFSLATLTQCSEPNSRLFWDDVHPTAHGHQVLGNLFAGAVVAAVPEPSTYAMLATGILLLFGMTAFMRRGPGAVPCPGSRDATAPHRR